MGNKTKLQMKADLRTDLKDSGALWSNPELNRCIDRAYSDFSRFLPDEKIYEDSLQFAVTGVTAAFPIDTDADAIYTIPASNGLGSTEPTGQEYNPTGHPDVPRPLRFTLTDDNMSIQGLVLKVTGIDKDDQAIEEISHYSKGQAAHRVWDGKKYFKDVYKIRVDRIIGAGTGDKLDIGYGPYTDVWVYLDDSPIKPDSDSAVGADGVAVVKNTDYYIDYANGRVKAISGGNISAREACTFAYTKSQIGIDLSGLPDLIRVDRIEYPVGNVPQDFVTYDIFGKWATVTGGIEGQERMSEDKQYRIYYKSRHEAAGEFSPGSEPSFLTDTVVLAASAYALFIKALQYEHQAVTDIAYVDTALDKVATYLETNDTADNAKDVLGNITDDIAELRDSISKGGLGALVNAKTFLAEVDTSDLAPATYGAEGLLNAAIDAGYITKVNVAGISVAPNYADFARARVSIANARIGAALGFIQEAAQRLSNIRSYIEEAGGWMRMGEDFIAEASARMSNVGNYLTIADRFRTEAIERRNEAWAIWRSAPDFIPDTSTTPVRQTSR